MLQYIKAEKTLPHTGFECSNLSGTSSAYNTGVLNATIYQGQENPTTQGCKVLQLIRFEYTLRHTGRECSNGSGPSKPYYTEVLDTLTYQVEQTLQLRGI